MNTLYRIVAAFCCMMLLAGCDKDDESAFIGQDNYITSFKLALEENYFTVVLAGDSLIVNTIESRTLEGATANVVLSENATIQPDPTGISDWDNAHSFVVTAFNGSQRTYHYVVKKEKIEEIKQGSFTLRTQTEVDDFGALGVKVLNGNLTFIDENNQEDPITSLAALQTLEEVKGALTVSTKTLTSLTGLENLRAIGSFSIKQTFKLEICNFPELEHVYGDFIGSSIGTLQEVCLPKLISIDGDFTLQGIQRLSSIVVSELESVEGKIDWSINGDTKDFKAISFPKLKYIGGAFDTHNGFNHVQKIDFPELTRCGGIIWMEMIEGVDLQTQSSMIALEEFNCPKLTEITGEALIFIYKMEVLSFPELTYAETLAIGGPDRWAGGESPLAEINLPKLKEVKNIKLGYLPKLNDLECLNTLETVTGTLLLRNMNGLSSVTFPASLTNVNELAVADIPAVTKLNLKGMGVKGVNMISKSTTPFKLTADDVIEGSLTLNGLFELVGMKEVKGNVTIEMSSPVSEAIELLPNTEIVGGDFYFNYYYNTTGSINFPALTSIKGTCKFTSLAPVTATKLKEVGKDLTYDKNENDPGRVAEFSLPALTSVGGDFRIYTGRVSACTAGVFPVEQGVPFDIDMKSLTTIGGILEINTGLTGGYPSPNSPSNRLANLDGFSNLTSVKGVKITKQAALRSFKGLEKAIPSFTAYDWVLDVVGYMPTYQELAKDGLYEDPSLSNN